MISRIFVVFSVVKDVVSVNGPASSNPLMNTFVQDALTGKLIFQIMLSCVLKIGLLAVNLIFNCMMIIVMAMSGTKSTNTNIKGVLHEKIMSGNVCSLTILVCLAAFINIFNNYITS